MLPQTFRKILYRRFVNFPALLIAIAILGGLVGSTIAYAHAQEWFMSAGNDIYGPITHSSSPSGWPSFSYDVDHLAWADDAYPDATHIKVHDTGYWDGWSQDPDAIWFGILWMYGEDGPSESTHAFVCIKVDGINTGFDTFFEDDSISSTNRYVFFEQLIWNTSSCPNTSHSLKHVDGFKGQD